MKEEQDTAKEHSQNKKEMVGLQKIRLSEKDLEYKVKEISYGLEHKIRWKVEK